MAEENENSRGHSSVFGFNLVEPINLADGDTLTVDPYTSGSLPRGITIQRLDGRVERVAIEQPLPIPAGIPDDNLRAIEESFQQVSAAANEVRESFSRLGTVTGRISSNLNNLSRIEPPSGPMIDWSDIDEAQMKLTKVYGAEYFSRTEVLGLDFSLLKRRIVVRRK